MASAIILANFTAFCTCCGPDILSRESGDVENGDPANAPAINVTAALNICSLVAFILEWVFNVHYFWIHVVFSVSSD